MDLMGLSYLLVVILLTWSSFCYGQCPSQCTCGTTTVTCSGRSSIPQDIPSTTVKFILIDSEIQSIPARIFDGEFLPHLDTISMRGNHIQAIQPRAFNNLEKLQSIDLANNDLEEIPESAFQELKLRILNLDANRRLSSIHDDAFVRTTLEELHIRDCNISTLSRDALQHSMETMQKFFMSNNTAVLDLPRGLFDKFNLKQLDLSYNIMLPSSLTAFQGASIEELDLSNNCLGDVIWNVVDYATNIQDLILKEVCTNITNITRNVQLRSLSLEGNYIRDLSAIQFGFADTLNSLILKRNLITQFPRELGGFLNFLRILDLAGNQIKTIDYEDLEPLNRLQTLDLRNNQVQTLDSSLLPLLSNLTELDLRGNPLHCNCELEWLAGWYQSLTKTGDTKIKLKVDRCAQPSAVFTDLDQEFVCLPPNITFSVSKPPLGGTLTISCQGLGDPQPSVNITFNGGTVAYQEAGDDRSVSQNELTYTQGNFSCMMSGNYSCIVSNIAGTEMQTQAITLDQCNAITTPGTAMEVTTLVTTQVFVSETPDSSVMTPRNEASTVQDAILVTNPEVLSTKSTPITDSTAAQDMEMTSTTPGIEPTVSTDTTGVTLGNDLADTSEYLSLPDLVTPSNEKTVGRQSDDTSDNWIIPVVVVVVVLAVVIILAVILVYTLKAKAKEKYDVDGRPHEMGHVNKGADVPSKVVPIRDDEKPPV